MNITAISIEEGERLIREHRDEFVNIDDL